MIIYHETYLKFIKLVSSLLLFDHQIPLDALPQTCANRRIGHRSHLHLYCYC